MANNWILSISTRVSGVHIQIRIQKFTKFNFLKWRWKLPDELRLKISLQKIENCFICFLSIGLCFVFCFFSINLLDCVREHKREFYLFVQGEKSSFVHGILKNRFIYSFFFRCTHDGTHLHSIQHFYSLVCFFFQLPFRHFSLSRFSVMIFFPQVLLNVFHLVVAVRAQ